MLGQGEFTSLYFKQKFDSCLLASFGVAAYPFIKTPVVDYFIDYCAHFSLDTKIDPELAYNCHFHPLNSSQKKAGLLLIKEFFDHFSEVSFTKCRSAFNMEYVDDYSQNSIRLNQILRITKKSILIVFVTNSQINGLVPSHSIVIGVDNNLLFDYDVNYGYTQNRVSKIEDFGAVGDCLLLEEK